ncbi:MAG TPA: PKD domain-containing protein, partial [Dehalococcoidia bacterium]|nr:PKD domain-containing protein [Dehalococcoidia bacterium]
MGIMKRHTRGRGMRRRFVTVVALTSLLALAGGTTGIARPDSATPVFAVVPISSLAFTPSPTTALVGQTVTFSATATTPNAGAIISSFNFLFGDGASFMVTPAASATASASATHPYSVANTYLASVTATDNMGGTGTANASVTVGAGQKITVSATPNTTFAVVGQPVGFSVAVTDPNTSATITNTTVNFGDGSATVTVPAGQSFVQHPYFAAGTFAFTATSTDSIGNTGTANGSIFVSAGGGLPINGYNPYNQYPYTGNYNGTNAYGTTGYGTTAYVSPTTASGTYYNPATNSYVPTTSAAPSNGISVSMAQGW